MDVAHEHAVLSRHLGNVQNRISNLIREKDLALAALTCEIVQLRAHLMIARTFVLWGMDMQLMCMNRQVRESTQMQPLIDGSARLERCLSALSRQRLPGHLLPVATDGFPAARAAWF